MATTLKLKGADAQFGYEFGCDGLWSADDVKKHLANISQSTVDRLVDAGKIRKGKIAGKRCYCVRSVREYKTTLES